MSATHASFIGSIPERYDRHLGPVIFEPYAMDLAQKVSVDTTAPVLEIACGSGILTQQLRKHLPATTELVATDLNPPMLDYAQAKLSTDKPIDWRMADAADLPFPAASFAAVACQFGLMFVPDKEAAFREARRVLVENGLFAFNVWGSLADNPFARIAQEIISSFFTSDPPTFFETPFGFNDIEILKRYLNTNDFGQISFEWVELEAYSHSASSFAIGLVQGNPVAITIAERGIPPEPIITELTNALVQAVGDQPFRSTMKALVVTARAGV
jgi:SAM-dependent methyltransferase